MLDMTRAMQITIECIRKVGKLFPAADHPIDLQDVLINLNIDNILANRLVRTIATDKKVGLPSLVPKRKIDPNVFAIDENSTVSDVFLTVYRNAILDNQSLL